VFLYTQTVGIVGIISKKSRLSVWSENEMR